MSMSTSYLKNAPAGLPVLEAAMKKNCSVEVVLSWSAVITQRSHVRSYTTRGSNRNVAAEDGMPKKAFSDMLLTNVPAFV